MSDSLSECPLSQLRTLQHFIMKHCSQSNILHNNVQFETNICCFSMHMLSTGSHWRLSEMLRTRVLEVKWLKLRPMPRVSSLWLVLRPRKSGFGNHSRPAAASWGLESYNASVLSCGLIKPITFYLCKSKGFGAMLWNGHTIILSSESMKFLDFLRFLLVEKAFQISIQILFCWSFIIDLI